MSETKPLSIIDGKTLLSLHIKPQKFIINRFLPVGLHMLAGSPKIGKSWLAQVGEYENAVTEFSDKRSDAEKCVDLLAKYSEIEQLTPENLNALISRIEIHECQPIDGTMHQKVDIYYRYAGVINPCEFSSLTFYHTKQISSPAKM